MEHAKATEATEAANHLCKTGATRAFLQGVPKDYAARVAARHATVLNYGGSTSPSDCKAAVDAVVAKSTEEVFAWTTDVTNGTCVYYTSQIAYVIPAVETCLRRAGMMYANGSKPLCSVFKSQDVCTQASPNFNGDFCYWRNSTDVTSNDDNDDADVGGSDGYISSNITCSATFGKLEGYSDTMSEISWTLVCSDGVALSGGAPHSSVADVALGATCTLNMADSSGDGWADAEWTGFGLSFALATGLSKGAESFVVESRH